MSSKNNFSEAYQVRPARGLYLCVCVCVHVSSHSLGALWVVCSNAATCPPVTTTTTPLTSHPSASLVLQAKLTDLRANMPARIAEVDAVLHSTFGKTVADVMAHARSSLASNAEVTAALGVVRDVLLRTSADLSLVSTWLKLKVPKVSDGGNFGVAVLLEVVKTVEAKIEAINKALDELPSYFSERGGAVDKVVTRGSTDEKVTKTKTNTSGGKDGDEEKASTTRFEEKSSKTNEALPDQVEHVVALDAKFFTIFKRNVELCQSSYLTCFDILEKNFSLLNAPRGDKGDSSHLSMF